MKLKAFFLFAALLLLCTSASAQTTVSPTKCSGAESQSATICFVFTNTVAPDSATFFLQSKRDKAASYTLIMDASLAAEGAASFQFVLRRCVRAPATHPTNSNLVCDKVLIDQDGDGVKDDLPLAGAPTGTNAIYNLRPGLYYIDVTTVPAAGQTATIRIEEE